MPLVLTTRRAGWQRRQPSRSGRERAVSYRVGGGGGGTGGSGPASRTGLSRESAPAASRLGSLASLRARGRVPAPLPEPLPWRAGGGAAERTAPGVRGRPQRQPRRGSVPGGAPGHGGAARRRAAESRVPGPDAERRSSRPERAGRRLWCRERVERPDTVPGSSGRRRAAPTLSRGLLQPFRSDCPHSLPFPPPPSLGLPLRALRLSPLPRLPLPPPFPPFLQPGSPSFPPSPLPSPGSSPSPTLSFSHTRADTSSLSALSPSVSLAPSFSFTFACPATF